MARISRNKAWVVTPFGLEVLRSIEGEEHLPCSSESVLPTDEQLALVHQQLDQLTGGRPDALCA